MSRRRAASPRTGKALLVLLLLALLGWYGPDAARWVDRNWLGAHLKDTWGALRWKEDWSSAEPLKPGLDRSWMQLPRPWRVAHALGAWGGPGSNSMAAFEASLRAGFRLFEVDVWLDADNQLRCYHGPPEPEPLTPRDCTLDLLLPQIARHDSWVILDIKTDFRRTGEKILDLARAKSLAPHVIFQLYKPADLALFNAWATIAVLPEPIVTAYEARRSGQHIADHAEMLHIRALTVKIDTLPSVRRVPQSVYLLVHPVSDCESLQLATGRAVGGIYTTTGLRCPG